MTIHGLTRLHVDASPAWRALESELWAASMKLRVGSARDVDFVSLIGTLEDMQMRVDALLHEEKKP